MGKSVVACMEGRPINLVTSHRANTFQPPIKFNGSVLFLFLSCSLVGSYTPSKILTNVGTSIKPLAASHTKLQSSENPFFADIASKLPSRATELNSPKTPNTDEVFDPTPDALIAKARVVLATDLGIQDSSILANDFIWIRPFAEKPLGKVDYLAAGKFFDLRSTFPDLDYRAHDFRIDTDQDPFTVRCTTRPVGTMRGSLRLRNEIIDANGKILRGPPEAISMTFDPKTGKLNKLCSEFVMDRQVGNTNGLSGVMAASTIAGVPPSDWEVYPVTTVISRFFGRPIDPLKEPTTFLAPFPETVMISLAKGVLFAELGGEDPSLLSKDFYFLTPTIGPIVKKRFVNSYASKQFGDFVDDYIFSNYRVDPYDPYRVWVDVKLSGSGLEGPPEAWSFTFDDDGFCKRITGNAVMDPSIGNTGGLPGLDGIKYALGEGAPDVTTRPLSVAVGRLKKTILSPLTKISTDEFVVVPPSEDEKTVSKVSKDDVAAARKRISDQAKARKEEAEAARAAISQVESPPIITPPPPLDTQTAEKADVVASKFQIPKFNIPSIVISQLTPLTPKEKPVADKAKKNVVSSKGARPSFEIPKINLPRPPIEPPKITGPDPSPVKRTDTGKSQKAELLRQKQDEAKKQKALEAEKKQAVQEAARQRRQKEQEEKRLKAEKERTMRAEQQRKKEEERLALAKKNAEQRRKKIEEERRAKEDARRRQEEARRVSAERRKTQQPKKSAAPRPSFQLSMPRPSIPIPKATTPAPTKTSSTSPKRPSFSLPRPSLQIPKPSVSSQEASSEPPEKQKKRPSFSLPRPSLSIPQPSNTASKKSSPAKAPPKAERRPSTSPFQKTTSKKESQLPKKTTPPKSARPIPSQSSPTFSIGSLFKSDSPETKAASSPTKKPPPPPKPNTQSKPPPVASTKQKVAPRGVPTIERWTAGQNKSITGFIKGSNQFKDGEKVTTSPISSGIIGKGEVILTISGSKYFLK